MKCVILQPSYIPWRGYFHQIQKADVFVFYDDVQYDVDGWRNRNRIKTPSGPTWLTIPVSAKGVHSGGRRICDIRICWDRKWNETHLKSLQHSYAKAPHFSRYEALLADWYAGKPELLAEFTVSTTIRLARELGIDHPRFLRSSQMECSGNKTERVLSVLKQVGATHYISGPSAKAYLDVDKLAAEGISVEWMSYSYPDYPQLYPPFDPQVSILDLLFSTGPRAGEYIWSIPDS
jgi:hypothetical protein